jgi:hypothetical protein
MWMGESVSARYEWMRPSRLLLARAQCARARVLRTSGEGAYWRDVRRLKGDFSASVPTLLPDLRSCRWLSLALTQIITSTVT